MRVNVDHAGHQEVAFDVDDRVIAWHVNVTGLDTLNPSPELSRFIRG